MSRRKIDGYAGKRYDVGTLIPRKRRQHVTTPDKPQDWPGPDDLDAPTDAKTFIENARRHGAGLLGPQAQVMPYVGIAGFTDVHEVRSIAADLYTMRPYGQPDLGGRRLAVGVLVSWKTLNGQPAGDPERYPKIERVRTLLDAATAPIAHYSPALGQKPEDGTTMAIADRTLRLIHYNSREPGLPAQVERLCAAAGPNLDGFQFNIAWPKDEDIRAIAQDYPALRIVLQVNREMFSNVGRSPQLLTAEIAKRYDPYVTDILFDMSGGTGAAIDFKETEKVLESLYGAFGGAEHGGLGIGIAGGLDYKNVYDLKPLFERWPDLSIDAEGRVRDAYKDAQGKPVTYLNENAREFARRALWPLPRRPETPTTP